MRLNEEGLKNRKEWEEAGYRLPQFEKNRVQEVTRERPFWIHFGAGNIFRAFQAKAVQTLLDRKILDCGLIAAEGFDEEIIEKVNRPHDDYSILATLKADGTLEKTVVGSVMESLLLDSGNERDFSRLKEIWAKSSLQMASFTITEKGYSLRNSKGELLPAVAADMEAGPEKAKSYMGKVAALLYARYQAGKKPIAMVSMDNCSHNGDKLYSAVHAFAERWEENGAADPGFQAYVEDRKKVSFPWTMIDKITPRPDASVRKLLEKDGAEGMEAVITARKTYTAAFVNAEECEYLVVEDDFPNGRPALEEAGFLFADRETVEKAEKMKVCTCLNPIHSALAVFGCLLGYQRISEEMKDPALRKLAEGIGYQEGLPVVSDPRILNPKEFLDTVLQIRLPNPFLPDTPQRIATDTSQKLAVRFGETVKAYRKSDCLAAEHLKWIPLVYAGWLRYLMGIDDKGEKMELSPDPMLSAVCPYVESFSLGEETAQEEVEERLEKLLKNTAIFGVDLCEAGLDKRVCGYLKEMLAGPGAVRSTLERCAEKGNG